jgi:hypothetical protein
LKTTEAAAAEMPKFPPEPLCERGHHRDCHRGSRVDEEDAREHADRGDAHASAPVHAHGEELEDEREREQRHDAARLLRHRLGDAAHHRDEHRRGDDRRGDDEGRDAVVARAQRRRGLDSREPGHGRP